MTVLATLFLAVLQPQEPRDLASLLEPIRAQHDVPALAAAELEGSRGYVDNEGKPPVTAPFDMKAVGERLRRTRVRPATVTAIGAVGVRRLGDATPVTVDDAWHLGSCGKAMTATAVARLVESRRLCWDTTLAAALPELEPGMHAQFRRATVRQLLDHRAGLPADTALIAPEARGIDRGEPLHRQRLAIAAAALAEAPLAFPGTAYAYSNTGYVIAGAILEVAAAQPWEQVMRDEVLAPLGMHSAGFGPPGRAGTGPAPWGHVVVLDHCAPSDPRNDLSAHPPFYGPAGDVHASLRDWARFVAAHLDARERGPRLLSPATLAAMHQPTATGADHACGFTVTESGLAQHGSSARWHALVRVSLEHGVAWLAVCNTGGERGTAACEAAVAAMAAEHAKGR